MELKLGEDLNEIAQKWTWKQSKKTVILIITSFIWSGESDQF